MNNEIWEKNLAAMDKWYPDFAARIREVREKEEEIEDDTEVLAEQSADGETIFRIRKDEKILYLGGRRDAKHPVKAWKKRLGKIHKYAAVFLFGIGSGAYLKALLEDFPEDANVIVYEPSLRIFLTLLQEVDMSAQIQKHPVGFLVEGINADGFEAVTASVLVLENIYYLTEEVHPNYNRLFGEKIRDQLKALQRYVDGIIINRNTFHQMSIANARNIIGNLKDIAEGYHPKLLVHAFPHDGTAILVSAGPSLNKNIRELKRAKNHCFIVAVDTAIKPLLKEGIVPDIMATVDAVKPLDLVNVKESEQIPIVAPPVAVPEMVQHQKAKRFFYDQGSPLANTIYARNKKELSPVAIGGSVACLGFSMVYMVGFNKIILVGQDLALTGNRTHADGTFQEKMPEEDTSQLKKVKGNCEDEVPTRGDFDRYRLWFEDYIKHIKEYRPVKVYNATEGGAYIEGTEVVTLKEILDEVCPEEEIDFAESIRNLESEFSPEEKEKALEFVREVPEQLAEIGKTAKQLKKVYVRLDKQGKSGNLNQDGVRKLLRRVKKLTKKCMEQPAYELIEESIALGDSIVRSEMLEEEETMEKEIREIARKGILYNNLVIQCADLLEEYAREVLLDEKPVTGENS